MSALVEAKQRKDLDTFWAEARKVQRIHLAWRLTPQALRAFKRVVRRENEGFKLWFDDKHFSDKERQQYWKTARAILASVDVPTEIAKITARFAVIRIIKCVAPRCGKEILLLKAQARFTYVRHVTAKGVILVLCRSCDATIAKCDLCPALSACSCRNCRAFICAVHSRPLPYSDAKLCEDCAFEDREVW